jgi:EAL domain-containing protein (putative c-di-GMP-specific phosphodiesterase class I)
MAIDPALLEMEITERVDFDEIAKRMVKLAAMGIRFAVDDFGTGYASLQHHGQRCRTRPNAAQSRWSL